MKKLLLVAALLITGLVAGASPARAYEQYCHYVCTGGGNNGFCVWICR